MDRHDLDRWHMHHALQLAARGEGHVEPNPMVGCLITRGAEVIGEGYHRRFGGPHAEIEALRVAESRAAGADVYVTLEPCCHHGKTPPCTDALIAAQPRSVVIAQLDPFPEVAGQGAERLRAAGIGVRVGVLDDDATRLNAPYLKLLRTGRPWVIAKWAMTLDGRIATHTGSSQWISGEQSRAAVHRLRGRVDAIIVGRRTAELDDPQLTARPPGARVATRVVLDSRAALSEDSQLLQSANNVPLVMAVADDAPAERCERLARAGCQILPCPGETPSRRLDHLLAELGRRRMTNVLVEGGGALLGSLLDARAIDEIHAFIAPKLIGGADAPSPIAGHGIAQMADALRLHEPTVETLDGDVHLHGRIRVDDGNKRRHNANG